MTKRNVAVYILLFVFAFTTGCGSPGTPAPAPPSIPVTTPRPTPAPTPTPTPAPPPDPVAETLAGLSTGQKVAQLLVAGVEGTIPGVDAEQAVVEYQVGGIILFGRNVTGGAQLAELTNGLKNLNGDYIPLLLGVDEEGGRVSRMPPEVKNLPSAYEFGQRGTQTCHRLGQTLAAACAAFGFNLDFAPSLDIWSNPQNTVIGDRAFGSDAETVTQSGLAAAQGLMEGGIIPAVKHFPGHGDTLVDSHKDLPVVDKTLEELMAQELIPFRAAAETELPVVMVAHLLMTQLDSERPASLSPAVVTGLLRQELGYSGVVCTDDLTMGAVANTYGMGEAAVLAVEAGCDLLLVCHKQENLTEVYHALMAAVESGRISVQRLDESVYRILSLKAAFELTNHPVAVPDVAALNERIAELLP